MRVVLTREKGFNDELRAWLPDDAIVNEVPLTTTHYFDVSDVADRLHQDTRFGFFAALVASSGRCARYVATTREALRDGGAVLAVGDATAQSLRDQDMAVDVVGQGSAINLSSVIDEGPVLLLGAASPREELRVALESRAIDVLALACYETRPTTLRESDEEALRRGEIIFIGAPSAWAVAQRLVRKDALVVVPGPTTAEIVRRSHDHVIEGWGPELKARLAGHVR
jgi:uroporphyrinogen-III synthase